MFNETTLEDYLHGMTVADAGKAYIRQVRASEPSRPVGCGARNVTTRFPSRKMGRTIQAESHTCELPALWHWEFDPHTREFWDQPAAVPLPITRRDGIRSTELKRADFLLLQDDFVGWVECKPKEWLTRRIAAGDANFVEGEDGFHYRPGEEFARQWGMQYVIRLDQDNNPTLVENLQILDDFLVDPPRVVSQPLRELALARLAQTGWLTLAALVRDTPGLAADDVFALIAARTLYADLERDRLGEPDRTYVYRDRDAAEAHETYHRTAAPATLPDLSLIDLSPGHAVFWDGNVWTILNDGSEGYFLQGEGQRHAEISRTMMQKLIGEGRILAGPGAPDPKALRAAQRLMAANDAQRAAAVRRYRALFPAADHPGCKVSERTLRYWRRDYNSGLALYGNGFVGLLPKLHLRGNRTRRLPDTTLEIVRQVIDAHMLTPESRSPTSAYGKIRLQCKAAQTYVPSQACLRREMRRLHRDIDITRARAGEKVAYQQEEWYWHLYDDTPRHGAFPFHVAHLDHTEIDLQLVDGRFERKTRKCWISAMIDSWSRKPLAECVTYDPPSYRSNMMVIRECVRRHGRVPQTIVVDWGADFRSRHFEQLTAYLGIQVKHRPKGRPRHGTLIERLFKTFTQSLVHQLVGNNKALQSPRSMSGTHDPRVRAVWTIERFAERCRTYLEKVYGEQIHGALGITPNEAFAQGLRNFGARDHQRIAFDRPFEMICLPSTGSGRAKVLPGGRIKIDYNLFHAPELAAPGMPKREVEVRYDPFNAGLAYAYADGRWIALKSLWYAVFSRYSEREIQAATQEIREKNRSEYRNRQVNAEVLARFLLGLEAEEAALRAKSSPAATPAQPPQAEPATAANDNADPFADLPVKRYGEF